MELEELNNKYGGNNDNDWYKCSLDFDSDNTILDYDINFNELYFNEI